MLFSGLILGGFLGRLDLDFLAVAGVALKITKSQFSVFCFKDGGLETLPKKKEKKHANFGSKLDPKGSQNEAKRTSIWVIERSGRPFGLPRGGSWVPKAILAVFRCIICHF